MRKNKRIGLGLVIFFLVTFSITTTLGQTTFTPSQLSQYDGKGGNKAYVALKGVVYDVSSVSKLWVNGSHNVCTGCIAGTDITILWEFAPQTHFSPGFMAVFPKVGTLVSEPPPTVTPAPVTPQLDTTSPTTAPPATTPVVPAPVTPAPSDNNTLQNSKAADDNDQSSSRDNLIYLFVVIALAIAFYWAVKNYRKK